jgi:hypothetical protein
MPFKTLNAKLILPLLKYFGANIPPRLTEDDLPSMYAFGHSF